ncbi:pilus assembly protein [Vibrio sp. S4M6]|uniref:TadE/TadG family type IV pilus assembly protein n=1 Tax=Vibrio sinus TaxID=2946865 RepID=UPI002029B85A|nr:TadE family protein [Vibrio sinus]MCL9781277.1 pilus assembly protein [Vibrio sinus]
MNNSLNGLRSKRSIKGMAAVEMTLVTPIIFLFLVGVWELTEMIQANTIITNISREGANLVSRSSSQTPQQVMEIVSTTSSPLDLESDGVIYISQVIGQAGGDPYLNRQYKWLDFGLNTDSEVWGGCTNWDAEGECELPDEIENKPVLTGFPINLDDGEAAYVVEVFYDYTPLTDWVYDSNFMISDATYL